MFKYVVIGLIVVGLAVVVFFAMRPGDSEDVLRMVVIPADDEVSTKELYQPFVDSVESGTGMKVELMTVVDYAAVVEAMKYGHADVARFGPFNYVLATEEADVEAVVVGIKKSTGQPGYYALIISRPDLESLEGATFAYVDPGSSSGYLFPNYYVQTNSIELGKEMFAGSHPAVIEAVKNGSVDAGAVASNRLETALREGVLTEGQVKIYWQSDLIPNALWAVQKDMDEELKQAFIDTLLNMPEDIVYSLGVEEIDFVPIRDEDYQFVRDVWKATE